MDFIGRKIRQPGSYLVMEWYGERYYGQFSRRRKQGEILAARLVGFVVLYAIRVRKR